MWFWLVFGCNKSPKEVVKSPSEGHRFTPAALERLGEPTDSVCRGLVLPEAEFEDCTVTGPFQGILEGNALKTGLDINAALQACVADPSCSGITTEWYADTPFATIQKTGGFVVDADSYGCSFVIVCSK